MVPIKTEKAYRLAATGKYTFAVEKNLTKSDIIGLLKNVYNVDAIAVTTLVRKGKKKYNWSKRTSALSPTFKKVYITLGKGQKLEIFK